MMAPAGPRHYSAGPKRVKLNILSQRSNVSFHQLGHPAALALVRVVPEPDIHHLALR